MASCRIVIQARLSSTRLPGKSLLPIKGIPVAVLCALRAANRGADVVVATSTDPSDDILASKLSEYSIKVVRGPLNDVLERFAFATADLAASDLVLRLTADNVFPDGDFVGQLVRAFDPAKVDYLGTDSSLDGLPYGLSGEVFTVRILREAAQMAHALEEREHVTPWIRRHCKCKFLSRTALQLEIPSSHLRCTIDSLDDYVQMARLFEALHADPARISWKELVQVLAKVPGARKFRIPVKLDARGNPCGLLSLGTAQLGMRYGAANTRGQPSIDEAKRIVHVAVEHGVTHIDTARAYGDAESRIGAALTPEYRGRTTVITKLDPLENVADEAPEADAARAVDASIFRSCRELGNRRIEVLMLHRWQHRRKFHGNVWQRLLELRDEDVIGALGASVTSPAEAIEALGDPNIEHVQLPYNLLDWRWESASFLEQRNKRPDVNVYVRSVYLQGILVSDAPMWPKEAANSADWIDRIDIAVGELKRNSRADLCMAYVAGAPWVTTIVVGTETEQQLRDNLLLVCRQPLCADERSRARALLGGASEHLLNPAVWSV